MSSPARDLAWEALVRVTHANPAMERGQLNAALKAIREACDLSNDLLALEIEMHAEAYHRTFPGLTLTPTALAKHWFRVMAPRGGSTSPQDAYEIARRALEP